MKLFRHVLFAVATILLAAACSPGNPLVGDWTLAMPTGGGMLYTHASEKTMSGMIPAHAAFQANAVDRLMLDAEMPYTYSIEGDVVKIALEFKGKKFSTSLRRKDAKTLVLDNMIVLSRN